MSVKRKVEKVNQIIEKGGNVAADKEEKEWMNVLLRLRSTMVKEVDIAIQEIEGISRTGFIIQAIREKLNRLDK